MAYSGVSPSAGASEGGRRPASPLNKIWSLARGLALHNKRFTIEKNIKIVATRYQILRLKYCTKSFVGWGYAPDPAGGSLQRSPRPLRWILGAYFEGEGRDERGREGRPEKGRKGKTGGEGQGGGRVDPQAKAWPPELFSWRRLCGKRILDFLLVLIELRNIKQEHKNMHEVQTKYQD